jgi:hypothetical protein
MTPEQLVQVCTKYESELQKLVGEAKRASPDISGPDDRTACGHILWMCEQTKSYAAQDMEKACRWLGYIQGVLWMSGLRTISEMRDDNR